MPIMPEDQNNPFVSNGGMASQAQILQRQKQNTRHRQERRQREPLKNVTAGRLPRQPASPITNQSAIQLPRQPLNTGDKTPLNTTRSAQGDTTSSRLDSAKNGTKNMADKLAKGDLSGDSEDIAEAGMNLAGKAILDTLWKSVWADYTSLSVWALDIYLLASIMIPSLAQFGDDNTIGKWLRVGGKKFAKIIEILILAVLNIFWAAVITIIIILLWAVTNPYDAASQLKDLFGGWWGFFKAMYNLHNNIK